MTPRARRRARLGAIAIAAASLAIAPAAARAAPPSAASAAAPEIVVIADAPASRQAVAGLGSRLPDPWRVADDAAFRRALAAEGQRTPPGVALGNPGARASLAGRAQAAAARASAAAVLFVRVTPKARGRAVTLLLVAPGSPAPIVDTTLDVPTSDEGAAVASAVAPALTRLRGPAASPPADNTAPPPPEAKPPSGDTAPPSPDKPPPAGLGGADRALFVFAAGGGTGARIFRYHDGLTPKLRSYDLAASPNLVLRAEVYPFARLSVPVVRGIGLYGGFQRALGVSSETSGGTSVSTTWWRAEGGLRLRLPLGEQGRFLLGAHGGIVKERFGFGGDKTLLPYLPDVDYLFWNAGVDGRIGLGPIAILLQASFLPAIQGGALADRFRKASFAAVEMGGGVAVPIVPIFEVRATAVYTRVFYSFHPEVGDVYVAGGALDHLVRAQILATLML